MKTLILGSEPLTIQDVFEVASENRRVELSKLAKSKIKESREFLLSEIKKGKTLYGVNTGFGVLSNVRIENDKIEALQYNILRSHACGVGNFIPERVVRAMLLLRASNLSLGFSGVSLQLVEQILNLLNHQIHPCIPEQGSVGASGDLAPLAHLALVLIGEGKAAVKGQIMSGKDALLKAKLKPVVLGPKEGLALINGTQFMTAFGALLVRDAEDILNLADLSGAMTLEALRGSANAFDADIHAIRPHPGQIRSAENLRRILHDSGKLSAIATSHEDCGKVQDPYSLRCMPQVHGASRDALEYVRGVIEREINSVTDNPLVFPKQKKILSGGNFHGQPVAIAMDTLAIAMAEIANISEQRIEKLINPAFSELPAFLVQEGGLNSGLMIVQVAAASIVSENKTLCHPASVDSIPTSLDKEDHVSMGAWAARKAAMVIQNVRRVLSMELLAASQGIDLLRPLRSTKTIEAAHQIIRKRVPKITQDRAFYEDLEKIEGLVKSGDLV